MNAPIKSRLDGFLPGRVWSLWDMVNFQIFGILGWTKIFEQERRIAGEKVAVAAFVQSGNRAALHTLPEQYLITELDRKRLNNMLDFADRFDRQLNLIRTRDRITHFRRSLETHPENPHSVQHQLEAMSDALHDDLKLKYFYFYPDDKVQRVLSLDNEWANAFAKFPSAKGDALAATDCYALKHNEACVFHCMRILEIGLRALAHDVGLRFDVQQWKNIIDEIEGKIKAVRDNGIPALSKTEKDIRLQFLSTAAKEFYYFKDGWRNYISHNKGKYDEYQARSVLEHVREFMSHLASQLSEVTEQSS